MVLHQLANRLDKGFKNHLPFLNERFDSWYWREGRGTYLDGETELKYIFEDNEEKTLPLLLSAEEMSAIKNDLNKGKTDRFKAFTVCFVNYRVNLLILSA